MRRTGVIELRETRNVAIVCTSDLLVRDFHFRGCTLTGDSSWKTITYRWLWIFRDSGSALFRSRECYGAEFSTVLFPLRHVPLLPFAVSRRRNREEKGQTRLRTPSPGWSFSDFLACLPGHKWERRKRKYKNQTEWEALTFWHFQVWWDFPLPFCTSGLKVFPQSLAS